MGEIPLFHKAFKMKTPSTRSILKQLRENGFPMDSIIEQSKGKVEIGYLTNGKVNLEDRKKTQKAADQACRILAKAFKSNFSWWGLGYGSCMVQFNYQTNELAWNNID